MLRPIFVYLVAALLGLFIQATVVHGSIPSAPAPDFILILTVILGMQHRSVLGVLAAFALGVMADFASGLYIGPNAAAGVIVFLAVGSIASRVYAERVVAIGLISVICSLVKSCVIGALLSLYLTPNVISISLLHTVLLESLFTGLLAPFLVRMLGVARGAASSSVSSTSAYRWSTENR